MANKMYLVPREELDRLKKQMQGPDNIRQTAENYLNTAMKDIFEPKMIEKTQKGPLLGMTKAILNTPHSGMPNYTLRQQIQVLKQKPSKSYSTSKDVPTTPPPFERDDNN
jgi:hypothetical protein